MMIPSAVISVATLANPLPVDVAPSPAQTSFQDPFAREQVLSNAELSTLRGGFEIAGVDIEVGVTVELIDGTMTSFATDPAAFVQTLHDLGFSERAKAHADITTLSLEGLTTIIANSRDNVTLSQHVTLDITAANLQQAIGLAGVHSVAATQIRPVYLTGF